MSTRQPISSTNEAANARPEARVARADLSLVPESEPSPAIRRHLPDERRALTHHFSIAGQEGYLTVGVYENGLPGEVFITMAKQGSTISGLMDSFATAVSLALQYGVPLGSVRQVRAHSLRAQRLVRQSQDRLRQVPYGLHWALAGPQILER